MHFIDIAIFILYILAMLGVGYYFMKKNKNKSDYYVGGRSMSSGHIGLSVVATDVGGGFSIGLGGLGFTIGVSGSWMLLTGLIGAWLSAVLLIPKVYKLSTDHQLFTFPQIFEHFYNKKVALTAALISLIGYTGFTSSQLLAGAKLAAATFSDLNISHALLLMGSIAVIYTVMGGLKAVIYTDTIQWIILMGGLIFIGIPMGYLAIGGMEGIRNTLRPEFIALDNISGITFINWMVTIIPIWFVGMTLYQRIYACKDKKTAQKAWFIAGLFEYPVMAFMGVLLGMFARVALMKGMFAAEGYTTLQGLDIEMGLPMLLKTVLPFGLMGLFMSAYFSAILSTADSCLMAASGNAVSDIFGRFIKLNEKQELGFSQVATGVIGILAISIAASMENVLEIMLLSYSFMVSGLFIPIITGMFLKKPDAPAAMAAMLGGGIFTLVLTVLEISLPFGLDPIIFGLSASLIIYLSIWLLPYEKIKLVQIFRINK
ncbi:MAG: sodium:solute symporter family protein [Cyclobacteriaceae bacterium]|nr:sodium:solute symporter family protein [Cyclobacteriaceae bacterium]